MRDAEMIVNSEAKKEMGGSRQAGIMVFPEFEGDGKTMNGTFCHPNHVPDMLLCLKDNH
jgi:hypothetical protein